MSPRLNPGDLFQWYPRSHPTGRPLIQAREVEWLLNLHLIPFQGRPDIPPCQCLTCIQGRRWWVDHTGLTFPNRPPDNCCSEDPQPSLVGGGV